MIKAYSYIRSLGSHNLKMTSQLAVLNANYTKERLQEVFHFSYDRPYMHECVFSDKFQKDHKVTTLDMAKRFMDYGFHPPTIYFPLVVKGAIMIEPTETESKEELDFFIGARKAIANEASGDPHLLMKAPKHYKARRMDGTRAARRPCLVG